MSMTVAVLFGGQSSEHPVSLMSATSVLENLDSKYTVYMVGITADGRWYHYTGPVSAIVDGSWENDPSNEEVILSPNANHHGFFVRSANRIDRMDVIFPVLHGRNGEDGSLQGLCQLNGIPLVSCDMTSSALVMDKEYTHIIAHDAGINMAKYIVLRKNEQSDMKVTFEKATSRLGLPFYVKPCKEGSSFGAHKVTNYDEFVEYVQDAFSYDRKILAEEFIDGYEVGAGVMGEGKAGDVFEIIVSSQMYGYAEKYDGYMTTINTPAKSLTDGQMDEIKRQAVRIYKLFGCDIMARVDFFMSSRGLVFNEVNSIPGFTSHSLYPASFKATGMSYSEILTSLIDLALGVKR